MDSPNFTIICLSTIAVNGKCGFETDVNNYSLLLFLFNNLNSLIKYVYSMDFD